ncbi:related to cell wall protein UTR2 [Ustilago trichophora]|uniref:Related to cell wall protein UTR2 n=1 Tax=Ustilago trichophora TaxID=86804 RepID=A0A5C3E2N1_9BASI|nr:related to cell wall protein UTR2 [Ustilago trichophora]
MSRARRRSAARLALLLLGALALLSTLPSASDSNSRSSLLVSAQTSRITCSTTSPCPESSPCCSAEGVCGSGSMQCAGGCDPMSSFKPTSCLPNPVCRSRQMTIKPTDYNNNNVFMPILEYNGNASSPFTLDSGSLGPGPEGVLLQLKAAQQAKISTTDYLMYGYVEATLRHDARQGLVAAFITMSSIKDEIDWEFTTSNSSLGMTNYFWMGQPVRDHGVNISPPNFNVSDWHTYGLNWTSAQLQWTIDGRVVRTLTREEAGSEYPRSPSRIQFSTWAGGNATNPVGTIEWAGGAIDWNTPEYKKSGFYSQEIKQFNVQCASLSGLNLTSVSGSGSGANANGNGSNDDVTSFVYTGANSSQTGEPLFGTSSAPLRILSDPGADGIAGYPGYGMTSSQSGEKGGKDGKGSNKDSQGKSQDGKANSKDDAADGSSVSTSDALKYALPISGAIVGLGAAWAIIAFVRRRHLKAPIINAIGVTGVNDPRFTGPSGGGYTRPASNMAPTPYQDVEDEASSRIYRNEPNMNLMMGGGIMPDAGLSHLQRQTTGGSKVSRSSSRSVADRLLRNSSKGQRYQQLDATVEEEAMDEVSRQSMSRPSTTRTRGSTLSTKPGYATHVYEQAAQEDEYVDTRYGDTNSYYNTPISSPIKRGGDVYHQSDQFGGEGDHSFEACQLQSPQRRGLPMTPYTPNYAPVAPPPQRQQQQLPRPSGRMYDTPNVNYYPTPVMLQQPQYDAYATPFAANAHAYTATSGAADINHGQHYIPSPPPRRHY